MNPLCAYVFIDGENHFFRSIGFAKDILGSHHAAEAISIGSRRLPGAGGFPHAINGRRIGFDPSIQLFWDCQLLSRGGNLSGINAHVMRAVFAGACSGDDDRVHEMRTSLRTHGFEPLVIHELKTRHKQRRDKREKQQLMEKAKGCDIALATRMVADAAADLYDCAFVFTSDADFLPAIESIRRMGKLVWVFGYKDSLPSKSPYLYVPDRFFDLGDHLTRTIASDRRGIDSALEGLTRN